MKIHGQGQPPAAGVADSDGAQAVSETDAAGKATESGRAFAEKLDATRAASGSAEVAGGLAVRDLAAAVRAGNLTSRAAVDELVDRIVAHQVGSEAPASVREQLKAALEDALENDPLLAAKLRLLG